MKIMSTLVGGQENQEMQQHIMKKNYSICGSKFTITLQERLWRCFWNLSLKDHSKMTGYVLICFLKIVWSCIQPYIKTEILFQPQYIDETLFTRASDEYTHIQHRINVDVLLTNVEICPACGDSPLAFHPDGNFKSYRLLSAKGWFNTELRMYESLLTFLFAFQVRNRTSIRRLYDCIWQWRERLH